MSVKYQIKTYPSGMLHAVSHEIPLAFSTKAAKLPESPLPSLAFLSPDAMTRLNGQMHSRMCHSFTCNSRCVQADIARRVVNDFDLQACDTDYNQGPCVKRFASYFYCLIRTYPLIIPLLHQMYRTNTSSLTRSQRKTHPNEFISNIPLHPLSSASEQPETFSRLRSTSLQPPRQARYCYASLLPSRQAAPRSERQHL